MSIGIKIALLATTVFVGVITVVVSRSAQVGADVIRGGGSEVSTLLTVIGYVIISVALTVSIFEITSHKDKKNKIHPSTTKKQ